MNRERFREIHDLLMEQLDVSRELSDEEILEVIDDLILNQSGKTVFFTERKSGTSSGAVLFGEKAGCTTGTD